ncbi:acyl-CoA thioesterase [Persephonella atlantica]|uniref:Acyl-CoA thioesterase n=1 Tax=Persephonella atlantica TaxID=2699429 RepID=A0ABS1GFL5_9AQUI|nr:thioesterase family protein [Persephonella atlantica]MBK3331714.1 acyl-CoA thioesterase [Persephonella atlantica]
MIYSRKVFFYETDAQGIVHHSNYPRYFEEARGFFLEQKGMPYERIREELEIDIVLLELSVSYRKPLRFGDRFNIHLNISSMDRFFFSFDYSVYRGETLIAEGKTKHTCINRKTGKITAVPQVLKQWK